MASVVIQRSTNLCSLTSETVKYMKKLSKTIFSGIVLAAILVTAIFTLPDASADLTALDKIGTILAIITNIQNIVIDVQNKVSSSSNEVTNIEEKLDGTRPSLVTNINQTVTGINEDLQMKKSFYHVSEEGDVNIPDGRSLDKVLVIVDLVCPPSIHPDKCAFNIEHVGLANGISSGSQLEFDEVIIDSFPSGGISLVIVGGDQANLLIETRLVQLAGSDAIVFTLHCQFGCFGPVTYPMSVEVTGQMPQGAEVNVSISNVLDE